MTLLSTPVRQLSTASLSQPPTTCTPSTTTICVPPPKTFLSAGNSPPGSTCRTSSSRSRTRSFTASSCTRPPTLTTASSPSRHRRHRRVARRCRFHRHGAIQAGTLRWPRGLRLRQDLFHDEGRARAASGPGAAAAAEPELTGSFGDQLEQLALRRETERGVVTNLPRAALAATVPPWSPVTASARRSLRSLSSRTA